MDARLIAAVFDQCCFDTSTLNEVVSVSARRNISSGSGYRRNCHTVAYQRANEMG